MQFFPFAGLAVRIAKSVIEEVASSGGQDTASTARAASKNGQSKAKSFEQILKDLNADGRTEESASNGEKQRLVVDPRTGRISLVGGSGKDADSEVILPELQKNGEAAKEMLKARIKSAGKADDGKTLSDSEAAEELAKALQALLSGDKVKTGADKLKMTKEDFAALKEALAEYGLSESDIESIGDKVESKAGLTWSAFASLLAEKVGENLLSGSNELTKTQSRHLQNFFQKLGFTPQQSAGLITDLKDGNQAQVWSQVSARIAKMPEGTEFTLDADELKALSQIMNLSDKSKARLTGLLSGAESGRVGKAELKLLAAALAQEAAEQSAGDVKSIEALRETVTNAFKLAQEREKAMKNASADVDGRARTYKALASESREAQEGDKAANKDKSSEGEVASRWLDDKNGGKDGKDKVVDPEGKSGRAKAGDGDEGGRKEAGKSGAERFNSVRQSGESEAKGEAKGETGDGEKGGKEPSADDKRAMREFLAKIKSEAGSTKSGAENSKIDPNAVADKAGQTIQAQNKAFEILNQAEQGNAKHILRQVQSGMLKAMGQGKQQLTLRLDPPDLGKVHVMLQVNRNEVNAVIRAESHDAARVVHDQLHHLRANLEAQGLKVSKLEVQTQTQQQDQQFQWQGAEQHNQQAREQGKRAGLAGLWTRQGGGTEALAQEMQNPDTSARNSREGLDIFA